MAGPLGLPWSTFAALVVVVASVVLAVVYALVTGRARGRGGDDE